MYFKCQVKPIVYVSINIGYNKIFSFVRQSGHLSPGIRSVNFISSQTAFNELQSPFQDIETKTKPYTNYLDEVKIISSINYNNTRISIGPRVLGGVPELLGRYPRVLGYF